MSKNVTCSVVLFGDQTELLSALRRINHRKDKTALLGYFLDKVKAALREELGRQPRAIRDDIPAFTTVFDLAERYQQDGRSNPAISAALLCVVQLATFIDYFETRPGTQSARDHACILGLGIGLLSAVAVASAPSMVEIIPFAIKAVRVAFRTGAIVSKVSSQIQPSRDNRENWSMVIQYVQPEAVEKELKAFYDKKKTSINSQAYISAVSKSTVTISGAPVQLKELVTEAEFFRRSKPLEIPVDGPYHAPLLYNDSDVQEIIGLWTDEAKPWNPSRVVLSTGSGEPLTYSHPDLLLQKAVTEILKQPLHWDKCLEGIHSHFQKYSSRQCVVFSLGTDHVSRGVAAKLRISTGFEVSLQDIATGFATVPQASGKFSNSKIAIVGMSGRFPGEVGGKVGIEALWKILEEGLDVHKVIPKDRFDVETHYDPTGKKLNTSHTQYGCFIENPGLFDARYFSMSPREAAQTDPMHRLSLVTAAEALEMSGFVPNRTPSSHVSRVGTFYGQTSDDWREVNISQRIDTFFIPAGVRAFGPGRINYFFKFSGPSYSIDTACSSSLAAIQIACTSLRSGECDTALAGGVNILTAPDIFAGLSRGMFLSKSGGCKTFDANADGYCRADGIGTVVLKRLEDAEADNDNILAVILGTATNHSAEAISITHPHAGAQSYLYESILYDAGIDAHDVSYIEMHGTGTQAGDKTETRSVMDVFAPRDRQRAPNNSLYLGAVKSNVGHGEAAAGITALVKLLLMLQKSMIPRHVGIKTTINPAMPPDMEERNEKKRLAFLNNFSAAGGNTGLLLEDAPVVPKKPFFDPRSQHVIVSSAKSIVSTKKNIQNLLEYIQKNPQIDLADLAYTTTARRAHHPYRVAIAASNLFEVSTQLQEALDQTFTPISSTQPKVAFVFTGQGAFYPALGKALYQDSPSFRGNIQQMNSMAINAGFPSIIPAIDGSGTNFSPVVTQLALCCIQMALTKLWGSCGIKPTAVIGHSLGEYAALNAAGVLSISDTINLVGQRAKLLEEKCVAGLHAMLAVKGQLTSIYQAANGKPFEVACINGKQEVVLCGPVGQIAQLSETLKHARLKCMILDVPYAFHSSQVEPILESFSEIAQGATFHIPKIPVISPLLSSVVAESNTKANNFNAEYLCRHAREPVNFLGALQQAWNAEYVNDKTVWIELGPHPICNNMIKASLPSINLGLASLCKSEDPWKTIAASLAALFRGGLRIDWAEVHRDFDQSHRLLNLPLYSFDEKNHWIQYEGDWSLTKGRANITAPAAPAIPPKSKLSTTSVHRIVEESFEGMKGKVVVESDISETILNSAVTGHLSIYADQALTVANYLYKELVSGDREIHMDVCNMEVVKPLIAKGTKEPQLLRITATTDLGTNQAELRYFSIDASGKETVHHATCIVKYSSGGDEWLSEWSQIAYLVKGRIRSLQKSVGEGSAQKLSRGTAYKLFATFVDYSEKFRGMQEVIVDTPELEATSVVNFQTTDKDGDFFCSPYWIDSLAHLSGFIMNGTDAVDGNSVYVSHGWKHMKFSKAFSPSTTYRSYVKMQTAGKDVFAGDVYILEGDVIIGVVGGLKFQRIPRRVLNTLLPPVNGKFTARTEPKPSISAPTLSTTKRPATIVAKSAPTRKTAAAPVTFVPRPIANVHSESLVTKAMAIVAKEAEMDISELQDECVFSEIGIDSLLSLTIAGKFREELNLDVPGDIFLQYPTVKALKAHLSASAPKAAHIVEGKLDPVVGTSIASVSSVEELQEGTTTPWSLLSSASSDTDEPLSTPEADDDSLLATIKATISEQMGLPLEEVSGGVDLGSLGMDSLMTISILGSLREQTGANFTSSFFQDHPTMNDIEVYLNQKSQSPAATPEASSYPQAQSILMQGNPKTAEKILFLIPDGSGSATSYATIPRISNNVAMFGLNCPFMTTPEKYTCSIEKVAELFLNEVKRRQPKGPYYLGGWSAGGVIAYQMVLHLIKQGEKVENLILFDSPCPVHLEALPHRLHRFFGDIGLLGSGGRDPPEWLLPHFEASIKALTAYKPKAIDPKKAPKVLAIWATDGVCKNPSDPRPPPQSDDPKSMKWLLENRTDFGYNGWDQILPKSSITCTKLSGVNHFSMMREPQVHPLAALIKRGLEL
ncbi:hypothetical protein G7Y89_g4156 [Cudoniella acicularis]|uniref:Polyketide synthase n=1 Tax=Cudoniella acicularis TaxID=354080 RepID=A0A8H4W4J7_9HELO|nr:hypothetical protein G7Y89_g4156 [Cudoniella acicularis]